MGEKLRILILEDVPSDAELTERALLKAGIEFESLVVDTRDAFVRALDDFRPDVILADYSLPSFDCPSALEIAKEKCPHTPVIVVTGSIGDELAVEILKKGATDYVLKDRIARLIPSIDRALREVNEIIERRRAEEALEQSEMTLRAIFDSVMDGILTADLESRKFIFANEGICRMLGYSLDEILDLGVEDIHPLEDLPHILEQFERQIKGEIALSPDLLVKRKDGSVFYADVNATPVELGGRSCLVGVFHDITERKRAEKNILNLNRMYMVLGSINQIIVRATDRDNLFREVCRIAVDIGKFNYSWIGILDQEKRGIIPFAHKGRVECPLLPHIHSLTREHDWRVPAVSAIHEKKCVAENDIFSNHCLEPWWEDIRACGSRSLAAVPIFFKKEVFGVFVVCADEIDFFTKDEMNFLEEIGGDISFALDSLDEREERRKAEEALRESEANLKEAQRLGRIGHWEFDIETQKINWSDMIFTLYERDPDIGPPTPEEEAAYYSPEDAGRLRNFAERAIKTGEPWETDIVVKLPGERLMNCVSIGKPIKDSRGQVIKLYGTIQDITERIKAETQLRQAQKMETVGQLAGGVAHDFNNILMAIMGYARFALRALPEDSPVSDDIKEILKNSERTANLTKQLLLFSRRQRLDPVVMNLTTVVQEMTKMMRRLIGEHIELAILQEPNLWNVKVDPVQIEQVIVNLAVNARDAMPGGGKLTVSTNNAAVKDAVFSDGPVPDGEYVKISVADAGTGMTDEVKSHLFEPFFTTKKPGKGTGLGLATSYGIIKQSGGYITAESEVGKGSVFTILLPRISEELGKSASLDAVAELPRGRETVLLAEDDASIRRMISRTLSQQGYRVLEAINGEEALQIVEHQGVENIHLLLTDMVMPLMGGEKLAERIRELRPDIKVIFMSGYTDDTLSPFNLDETHAQFIQKPVAPEDIIMRIRRMLDR